MEQFFIDAVTALCKQFNYKVIKTTKGLSIEIQSQFNEDITQAINYLNLKANSKYSIATKSYRDLLDVIFREGYSLQDVKDVIDIKCSEWINDSRMRRYIRPSTIFNRNKFDQYMEQVALNGNNTNTMFDLLKDDWNE